MFGCLHVSDSDLRHPTSDVRQRFFRSGTEKIGWQVTLDECRQNNGKVETKFAVANRPSDVVSHIHVYVDLLSCIGDAVNAKFQLSATAGNFTSLITLNHIKSTFITLCWLLYYISHTFYLFIYLHSIIVCC